MKLHFAESDYWFFKSIMVCSLAVALQGLKKAFPRPEVFLKHEVLLTGHAKQALYH